MVDAFVSLEFQLPIEIKGLTNEIRYSKQIPSSYNFNIIKSRSNRPETTKLIVFMFHGWDSSQESMIYKTREWINQLVEKQSDIDPSFINNLVFVQLNAPFVCEEDEIDNGIKTQSNERFWWTLDTLKIVQMIHFDQFDELFGPKGEGLDFSIEYARQIVNIVRYNHNSSAGVIFAGFSQGGGMALNMAIECPENLCGVCICSGLLNNFSEIQQALLRKWYNKRLMNVPIFHSHGSNDPTLSFKSGKAFHHHLKHVFHGKIVHHTFNGYHEITKDTLDKMCFELIRMWNFHLENNVL